MAGPLLIITGANMIYEGIPFRETINLGPGCSLFWPKIQSIVGNLNERTFRGFKARTLLCVSCIFKTGKICDHVEIEFIYSKSIQFSGADSVCNFVEILNGINQGKKEPHGKN